MAVLVVYGAVDQLLAHSTVVQIFKSSLNVLVCNFDKAEFLCCVYADNHGIQFASNLFTSRITFQLI